MRLPLRRLVVAHPDSAILKDYVGIIAEEVNVKAVELTTDVAAHGSREIKVDPVARQGASGPR